MYDYTWFDFFLDQFNSINDDSNLLGEESTRIVCKKEAECTRKFTNLIGRNQASTLQFLNKM